MSSSHKSGHRDTKSHVNHVAQSYTDVRGPQPKELDQKFIHNDEAKFGPPNVKEGVHQVDEKMNFHGELGMDEGPGRKAARDRQIELEDQIEITKKDAARAQSRKDTHNAHPNSYYHADPNDAEELAKKTDLLEKKAEEQRKHLK